MLKNATGCLQMLSISLLTPSEPFVTNQYAEDYWMSMLLISGRKKKTTAYICVVHVCVINLREIALSPTVLDSNVLSTININNHQTLNIFSYPWYRPMGTELFIMPICRPEEKCLVQTGGKKTKIGWKNRRKKNSLLRHSLFISHMTNIQFNKHSKFWGGLKKPNPHFSPSLFSNHLPTTFPKYISFAMYSQKSETSLKISNIFM